MDSPFKVNGVGVPHVVEFSEGRFSIKVDEHPPLPLSSGLAMDDAFEGKGFATHFLYSPGISESGSQMVFHKPTGRRIGWIIPVSALDSDLHTHKDNPHFLKYAYIAAKACLQANWDGVKFNSVEMGSAQSMLIADIFPEFTAVLVISLETIQGDVEFEIDRAVPSMMVNGYIPLGAEVSELYGWEFDRAQKVMLCLSPAAPDEHGMVKVLLYAFARARNEPLLQFFFLYQIVEILLERVMQNEYSFIASRILEAGQDSSRLKLAIDGVGKSVSEGERLKMLNSRYVKKAVDTKVFDRLCVDFLRVIGRWDDNRNKPESGLNNCMYQVRNAIFHGFRNIPEAGSGHLKGIVKEMLVVIVDILCEYTLPTDEAADQVNRDAVVVSGVR